MKRKRTLMKVGMVIYNDDKDRHDCGEKYIISRIEHGNAYYHGKNGSDVLFTYNVGDDNHADISDFWIVEYPNSQVKSKVLSRECKCGIFRGDCTYHKDQ